MRYPYQKWDTFRPGHRGFRKVLKHRIMFLILGAKLMREVIKYRLIHG